MARWFGELLSVAVAWFLQVLVDGTVRMEQNLINELNFSLIDF